MKAILLMFDSLNLSMLQPYGCEWTKTPNFQRLAEHSVKFTQNFAGSLPCMPARRELHTGRYNFLHRSWGPLEPFDDSMPQILKDTGVYSHLISDHMHYWEDGGATYHSRYNSWEIIRGQEGDKWKASPELIQSTIKVQNKDAQYFMSTKELHQHDQVNRSYLDSEEKMPMAVTFEKGLEFIDKNNIADRWFLQIECFDPHEPFYTQQAYKDLYPHEYKGTESDWPPYHHVTEDDQTQNHYKMEYAALLTMCDDYLGKLLDKMDELNMWEDTMLIVNTDHGYLLGEHGWWSKVVMPCYDEITRTPLFVYDPRLGCQGESRDELVQLIDIPATILEFFGIAIPKNMQGKPLRTVIADHKKIRDYALFGIHGAHVNIFDGEHVYMKAPVSEENKPLYEYTLLPLHMRNMFSPKELSNLELQEPFNFTKGCKLMKIPKGGACNDSMFSSLLMENSEDSAAKSIDNNSLVNAANFGDKLFNLRTDPRQEHELRDVEIETKMANLLVLAMKENESPAEQFDRIGLPGDREVIKEDIEILHRISQQNQEPLILRDYKWTHSGINTYRALLKFISEENKAEATDIISQSLKRMSDDKNITSKLIVQQVPLVIPEKYIDMVTYFIELSGRVF
ncbi:MAG: sulfatase [Herbinix sp.]|nr:sulfatase [Herbinix sp.]